MCQITLFFVLTNMSDISHHIISFPARHSFVYFLRAQKSYYKTEEQARVFVMQT